MFDWIEDEEQRAKAIAEHNAAMKKIEDGIAVKIDEAVSGLKSKNAELLDEKKKISETLKNFDNIDAEKARSALQFLEENADAQLIKDGKIDELLAKRTSQLQSDHETLINELTTNLDEANSKGKNFENLYTTKMIEDSLRETAVSAKVIPEAISDVLTRGREVFSLAEDGTLEARGPDGKLLTTGDDKVLMPSNWIEGLKKVSPHYWPPSEGAGANGGTGGAGGEDTMDALSRAASSNNMVEYRRIREKMAQ
jgi:hypothetical protein